MANWHAYRCTFRGGTFAVGDRPLTYGQIVVLDNVENARKVRTSDITGGYLEYLGEVDAEYGYLSQNISDYQDGKNQQLKRNYLPVVTFTVPLADTAFDVANKMAATLISPSRRLMLDKVVARCGALPSCSTGAGSFNLDNRVHMLLTKGDPGVSTQITTLGYCDNNGTLGSLGLPGSAATLDTLVAAQDTIYLGSTSKFAGVFVEMTTDVNSSASLVSVAKYWNGTDWTAFDTVADYTVRTGITLAGDGWIAWFEKPADWSKDSPVASAHSLVNSNSSLTNQVYWISLEFTGNFDANTEINRVWIPEDEPIAEMEFISVKDGAKVTASIDAFDSVIKQDDTVLTEVSAGVTAGLLNWSNPNATDDALYLGYTAPLGGILFDVGATVNANASNGTASYWNGAEWVSLGITDGTLSVGGKTLSGDGTYTWAMPSDWQVAVATSAMMDSQTLPATTSTDSLYWIKVTWSANLTDQFDITNVYPVRSSVLPLEFNVPVNCELAPSDYLNVYVGEVEADADVLTAVTLELVGADI